MSDSGVTAVRLRQMREGDISFAMEVRELAGWNQTARDWRGYLEFEPEGCFLAEIGERPVGTATTIRYGTRFGWVGMVLVHPSARRMGVGTRLLREAIDYLQGRGVACVKLDATPMGRPVYLPLGFQDEYEISRYQGVASNGAGAIDPSVRQLLAADLPEITAMDSSAFGAERAEVLRSLSARNPELCWVQQAGDRIRGYLLARQGHTFVQVGSWVCADAESAAALWSTFLRQVPGLPVLVDVPHPNSAALALIEGSGFTVQRGFSRMYLGENAHAGDPAQVFGTGNAEKG